MESGVDLVEKFRDWVVEITPIGGGAHVRGTITAAHPDYIEIQDTHDNPALIYTAAIFSITKKDKVKAASA